MHWWREVVLVVDMELGSRKTFDAGPTNMAKINVNAVHQGVDQASRGWSVPWPKPGRRQGNVNARLITMRSKTSRAYGRRPRIGGGRSGGAGVSRPGPHHVSPKFSLSKRLLWLTLSKH